MKIYFFAYALTCSLFAFAATDYRSDYLNYSKSSKHGEWSHELPRDNTLPNRRLYSANNRLGLSNELSSNYPYTRTSSSDYIKKPERSKVPSYRRMLTQNEYQRSTYESRNLSDSLHNLEDLTSSHTERKSYSSLNDLGAINSVSNESLDSAVKRLEKIVSQLKKTRESNAGNLSRLKLNSTSTYTQELPQNSESAERSITKISLSEPVSQENKEGLKDLIESQRKGMLGQRYWMFGYMHENWSDLNFKGSGLSTELAFSNAFGIHENLSVSLKYRYVTGDMGEQFNEAFNSYLNGSGSGFPPSMQEAFSDSLKEALSDVGIARTDLILSYQFDPLFSKNFRPHLGISLGYYMSQVKMLSDSIDVSSNNSLASGLDWASGTTYSINVGGEYLLGDHFSILSELSIHNIDPSLVLSLSGGWLFTESFGLLGGFKFGPDYFAYNADFYWHF